MTASPDPSVNMERIAGASAHLGLDLLSSADLGSGEGLALDDSVSARIGTLRYAVVGGIRLSQPVLDTVVDAPTWTYYYHYRTVNFALDQAALFIAGEIQRMGHEAFPVPASQILDWDRLKAHLSHRETGGLAGLGWKGRNNLLVNPRYGSMCRYVTVLTDMPLPAGNGEQVPGDCGECRKCISACPVGAIKEDPDGFDLDRCAAQLRRFARSEKI
ncbi:MAG TPA: reductive dehalogenase domain-containing protein, partial [Candidatus Krumholzibacterium sp.]|nr:reductive dehalogenase domain-containing protein [Candidatus Krumholzibacterium sp.]